MPHSSTVTFLTYWRGLQPSPDRAPMRDRFDPARLKSLIPQMIMISGHDNGYRFRLSGGFVVALHGYELKDTVFPTLFRSPFLNTVRTSLAMAVRRQQPLILRLSAPWQARRAEDADLFRNETVGLEVCLCPLANNDGVVDRLVGIYQTLPPMPKFPHGTFGRYTLVSSRLYEQRLPRAAHLRLVASHGRRIA